MILVCKQVDRNQLHPLANEWCVFVEIVVFKVVDDLHKEKREQGDVARRWYRRGTQLHGLTTSLTWTVSPFMSTCLPVSLTPLNIVSEGMSCIFFNFNEHQI